MNSRCRNRLAVAVVMLLGTAVNIIDAAAGEEPPADPLQAFEAREYAGRDGYKLPYRLLKPLGYDAEDRDPQRRYPLVLFLHGAGERGADNQRQLVHGGRNFADPEMRRRHPAFIMAPQCPEEQKWVEVPWDGRTHGMPAEPSRSLEAAFLALALLEEEFPIDPQRIYAVGLSMGGFGTWDVLQRKPELLAAAIPICGGGDPQFVAGFKTTPVWAFHGADDPIVIPQRSREMVDALQAVGGNVIYTEYEGVGHDSWTPTFDNRLVWDWLFAQRRK